jgi:hypothetical protein
MQKPAMKIELSNKPNIIAYSHTKKTSEKMATVNQHSPAHPEG